MPNSVNSSVAKRAAVLANPITNDSIFLTADSASFAAATFLQGDGSPGLSSLDGGVVVVKASGKVTVKTSSTLFLTLYYSAAARTAITYNGTGVSSLGTVTSGSMTAPYSTSWFLQATMIWDYTSLIMNGYFQTLAGPTPTFTASAVTTQVTAADWSLPGAGFVMGAHLGSGNAASTVTLSNHSLEVL